jgi:hypothetical protein
MGHAINPTVFLTSSSQKKYGEERISECEFCLPPNPISTVGTLTILQVLVCQVFRVLPSLLWIKHKRVYYTLFKILGTSLWCTQRFLVSHRKGMQVLVVSWAIVREVDKFSRVAAYHHFAMTFDWFPVSEKVAFLVPGEHSLLRTHGPTGQLGISTNQIARRSYPR